MFELIDQFDGSDVFSVTLPEEPVKTRHWVRATEVCPVLGFANTKQTLEHHCKEWQYREFKVGRGRPALYVCFSGLMRLCLKSKSPLALEFQDWLTEELLPKLFASGYYVAPGATSEQLQAAQAEIAQLQMRQNFLDSAVTHAQLAKKLLPYNEQVIKHADHLVGESPLRKLSFLFYYESFKHNGTLRTKRTLKEWEQILSASTCDFVIPWVTST